MHGFYLIYLSFHFIFCLGWKKFFESLPTEFADSSISMRLPHRYLMLIHILRYTVSNQNHQCSFDFVLILLAEVLIPAIGNNIQLSPSALWSKHFVHDKQDDFRFILIDR